MLLILAQPIDEAANRFEAYAQAMGVTCLRPHRNGNGSAGKVRVGVSVRSGRDGVPQVAFPPRIAGVLNRGIPLPWEGDEDARFLFTEVMAAWWSALASFDGPVVNRPAVAGFLPNLEAGSLAAAVPNVFRRGWIASPERSQPRTLPAGTAVNVHRVRDGWYIGRVHSGLQLDPDELYQFTPFDPKRAARILLAGNRLFDLSAEDGMPAPEMEERLRPLAAELRRRGAFFSSVVVEPEGDRLCLLQTTVFPLASHYRSFENEVHRALLDYLEGRMER